MISRLNCPLCDYWVGNTSGIIITLVEMRDHALEKHPAALGIIDHIVESLIANHWPTPNPFTVVND